jgi:hypothetical protein
MRLAFTRISCYYDDLRTAPFCFPQPALREGVRRSPMINLAATVPASGPNPALVAVLVVVAVIVIAVMVRRGRISRDASKQPNRVNPPKTPNRRDPREAQVSGSALLLQGS